MVITMAKLRMAHASTHGASKPPGPVFHRFEFANKRYHFIIGYIYSHRIMAADALRATNK